MPELPEVETIRRSLEAKICGRPITGVEVRDGRLRHPVDKAAVCSVVGRRIVALGRRGKYLLMTLDDGRMVVIHLGMSGHLRLCAPGSPLERHDHVLFTLGADWQLRYNDPRRFGTVQVVKNAEIEQRGAFANLGPEPLSGAFTAAYLRGRAQGRSVAVKSFLMDCRVVAGVGNIYANEALFRAGINPLRAAGSLSALEWRRLRRTVREVLRAAIKRGGTTLGDERFRNPEGEKGYFQVRLDVYGREGLPCPRCGANIVRVRLAGRSTYFCPGCQR
ncbi:MAG: bifunctional DNA-formamidopyrimidine glycosylase/DNA-(apurinic or apyrimidinic site) lyase [bacterium]|jgi:formamidopyrimidine-DNA glycosylase|nr:bifunctional DNA-formamidopyrimidine glycosylase/DNA-(apurinic or apyrimidinic site) lyase [candidate division KSB1 bacterium]MDH7560181.1 bifunctional DNA-formamidopyrimidine glycosylase/DNA-(apurinic or apyrimidinic site) lyase [bacterium]